MPIWSNQNDTCREVAVLLFNRFSNHCLANTIEPMRAANDFLGRTAYRWRFVTLDGAPVASSSGFTIVPDGPLSDIAGGDLLITQPSYDYQSYATPACNAALKSAARRFKILGGFDGGSWLLAAAGLLDGYAATIHFDEYDLFEERFPNVHARRSPWIIDRDRVSAGGAMTAFDLIQELIGREHGTALTLDIAGLFLHGENDRPPPPGAGSGDPKVDRALAIMRARLESPLTIGQIARQAGCRQRDLETRFQRTLGATPRTVYQRLRLSQARRLARAGTLSIAEIALRCGYSDTSAFARAFRRAYGEAPRAARP